MKNSSVNDAGTPNDAVNPPQSFVAYMVNHTRHGAPQIMYSSHSLAAQEKAVQEFLRQHPGSVLSKTFIETADSQRHRNRWPELEAAVNYCLETRAHLLIGEIKNLTNNDYFAQQILRLIGEKRAQHEISATEFIGRLHCCDQPLITNENFTVLVEHAKQQKKLHGQLIKAGLSRTTAKSGNPHASEVISKVNRPKIDNAITFALMLQPVIQDYQAKGYSQRKMVAKLNEEGFTAPEGGPWVLSQLQKVLDRIRTNEAAISLEKTFAEYKARHYDNLTIAESLNKLGVPCPKGKEWTEEEVERVGERIKQIQEIIHFNEFIIELMPIIEKYNVSEFTEETFANELKQIGITLPQRSSIRPDQL